MSNFTPRAYLTKIQGKEYLEVAQRLRWLNEEQERFTIDTTLLHWTPDYAVVRAIVTLLDDDGHPVRSATGHGQAIVASMPAHIRSRACEKAETSAVGRALGMLGLGTLAAQTFDDTADDHLADSPVEPIKNSPADSGPATEQQLRAIHAHLTRSGAGAVWLKAHGVTGVESLTRQGAAQTLAALVRLPNAPASVAESG